MFWMLRMPEAFVSNGKKFLDNRKEVLYLSKGARLLFYEESFYKKNG